MARAADSGCPYSKEIARCPLYALAHDARFSGYGCVRDLAEPCLVEQGKWTFDRAFTRALKELMRRVRKHYLKE